MRVIFQRAELLSALNLAAGVIKARTPKPVLACVKLVAGENNAVSVFATDLEMSLSTNLSMVQVERAGETALNAEDLRSLCAACECDTVAIDVENERAKFIADSDLFKLSAMKASDFPPAPKVEGEPTFKLEGASLLLALSRTTFAISEEAKRYTMAGECIEVGKGKVNFVATDGYRLAMSQVTVETSGPIAGIVPLRAINLVPKLIDAAKGSEAACYLTDRSASFVVGSATLTTQLLEGQFAPWKDIVPNGSDRKVTVDTPSFLSAVRRCALMKEDTGKGIRFNFNPKAGVTMLAFGGDRGESDVKYPCKVDGAAIDIVMNPKYVTDAARALGGEGELYIEMTVPSKPIVFRNGPDAFCVVMPVNLQ